VDDLADEVCDGDGQEHIGVVSAVVSWLRVLGDLQQEDIPAPRVVGGEVFPASDTSCLDFCSSRITNKAGPVQ
jgi:hypothetical protein